MITSIVDTLDEGGAFDAIHLQGACGGSTAALMFLQQPAAAQAPAGIRLLLAAKWLGDQEKTAEPVFQLWTRTGFTFASFKEDWANESLKDKVSPLVDPYIIQRYTLQIEEAKRLGLTRSTFSFSEWVDTSFLEAALRELHLEGYWQHRDEKGQPTRL